VECVVQEESCLAVVSDLWEKGIVWNDIACYHEKEGLTTNSHFVQDLIIVFSKPMLDPHPYSSKCEQEPEPNQKV
jgi:hypothetical protein